MNDKPVKVYVNYSGDSGCSYHRALLPVRFCRDEMRERGVELLCGSGIPDGHDVYVFNGLPPAQTVYDLANVKRKGATLVWSVDDDWLSVPEWNPANPGEGGLVTYEIMCSIADHIVVSTPHLAKTFARFQRGHDRNRVHTCPNLIDLSKFTVPPYETADTGSRYMVLRPKVPVRVVWAGSHTHSKDVEEITDALDAFCAKFLPSRAELVFFGMSPPAKLVTKYLHRGLFHQPTCPLPSYQSVLNSIDPHVYLAPLAKVEFNLSKSNLRIMEAWGLCAAPIATDWGEYACIDNGVDGRLVETGDQWLSAITRLVTDHEQRVQMASHGRMRVEQTMSWHVEECRRPWCEMYCKIAGVEYRSNKVEESCSHAPVATS